MTFDNSSVSYCFKLMARQPPSIAKLEEYIGAFYDDVLDAKIKSSRDVL